jgi:hypothetical protein
MATIRHKIIWTSAAAVTLAAVVLAIVFAIAHTNGSPEPLSRRPGDVAPQSSVAIIDDCANAGRIEPRTIELACGDGAVVAEDLSWSQWSSGLAVGHGIVDEVSCIPDCANGQDVSYRAALTLTRPVRADSGARYFTRIVVAYLRKSPTRARTAVYADCFASPPAPYLPRCQAGP